MDTDEFCSGCRAPLAPVRQAAVREQKLAATPQFAYLFAATCGAIPIATLGGVIPLVLGLGGAGLCMGIARAYSVPTSLRFIACLGITVVCWLVFITIVISMFPEAKKRFDSMLGR
jgi:hypothetical protein